MHSKKQGGLPLDAEQFLAQSEKPARFLGMQRSAYQSVPYSITLVERCIRDTRLQLQCSSPQGGQTYTSKRASLPITQARTTLTNARDLILPLRNTCSSGSRVMTGQRRYNTPLLESVSLSLSLSYTCYMLKNILESERPRRQRCLFFF